MAQQTPARQLYDLLVTKNFNPELLDSSGKPAEDPSEAEIFSFDYTTESGNDYGTVVIMLGTDKNLDVFFGDNVGRTMESEDKTEWFDFLYELKQFATKNFMDFGTKNINRLRYSMQGQAAIKEGLFESWTGKKDMSWNGQPTEARLMIKHKRVLDENEARYRYIESLFIETTEGERYKLPFTKLSGGRAMVEHVRAGGRPYDARGQHIAEIVNELNVLSRFRRANQGKIFEGDTAQLVEQTDAYYETAQRTLKSLGTNRGYASYFESWNPAAVTEEEVVIEGLKHLFVTQSIDTRIESALPLLAKIQQQGNAMKEASIFESWIDNLAEGTWALPDTKEKQAELVELMSKELPVGADATNVTEQLYDLIGDDHLFDQLEELAERDANADARQIIYDRMQELSDDPDVRRVIEQLQIDDTAAMNPAEPTEPVSSPADATPAEVDPTSSTLGGGNTTRLAENVLKDDTGSTFQHILDTYKRDVKDFETTDELSDELYHALYDYYHEDMPYGVKKARTGDPHEWVADRFAADLGIPGAGMNSPGEPDEDYTLERESVMHGDYAEESVKDPYTQTEDPAGTPEPAYPEYQDDLSSILKHAGVQPQNNPAPDYETGVDEGAIGSMLGGIAGSEFGGPVGAKIGSMLGDKIGDEIGSDDDTNESVGEYDGKPTVEYRGIFYVKQPNGSWASLKGDHVAEPAVKQVLDKMHATNEDLSPLAGQYGHSGKMKEVSKDLSFLDRLKELSGMKK